MSSTSSKQNGKNSASHFTKFHKQLSYPGPKQSNQIMETVAPKRTLLFDLDETLIHCVDDCSDPSTYQHMIEIHITKNKQVKSSTSSISSSNKYRQRKPRVRDNSSNNTLGGMQIAKAGINVRPFAVETLKECSEMGFEVGIFTASH